MREPRPSEFGVVVPSSVRSLAEVVQVCSELELMGIHSLWAGEVNFLDAMSVISVAATHTQRIGLGTCVLPVFGRAPATIALAIASVANAAPGRSMIGLGASSARMVEKWYGQRWETPIERCRDLLRFLRSTLNGERVSREYETFAVDGFRLAYPPAECPPLLLAALRPRMLRLARDEADGAITNWLAPGDVKTVRHVLGDEKILAGMVYVYLTTEGEDWASIRDAVCPLVATYLSVPTYAAYQRWLGRAGMLSDVWEATARGSASYAASAVPDELLHQLVVIGSARECRDRLEAYRAEGLSLPLVVFLNPALDVVQSVHLLLDERRVADRV